MKILIDTSALLKLFLPEAGRESALDVWMGASAVYASRLCYAEARAALARAHRAQRVSDRALQRLRRQLDGRWNQITVLELTDALARAAGDVAERYGLRAGDAVHLASALALRDPELTVATWDRRLARAASDAGLPVTPPIGSV